MRGGRARVLAALVVAGALLPRASAAPDAAAEYRARAKRAVERDAADLRKVAEWGDRNGLERTCDVDWEEVLRMDPDDAEVRKRLHWLRRGGAWLRDEATWAIVSTGADEHPERRPAYEAKRRAEYERPGASRHRDLAIWARGAGLPREAEAEVRLALRSDPDDALCRLALGEVLDPSGDWVNADLRARRIAGARAAADVRRLKALRADPVGQTSDSPVAGAVGVPLLEWRLREWDLHTDLPEDQAIFAMGAVDLGARWFRDFFGIPPGDAVLPGRGVFTVLTTEERYQRAIGAHPGLTDGERTFAKNLGAFPLRHRPDRGPWEVVIERPDGATAADTCLHYAIHLLMQARFGIEAQEAWLYEGLAAYAVVRLMGTHASWCVRMEPTAAQPGVPEVPEPPQWPAIAATLVVSGDDFALRGLIGVSPNGLDAGMLVKSWSILRWLLEERPDEARDFLEAKRLGVPTEAAIRLATGLSLETFEAVWRGVVLAVGPE